nr:DUF2798 domain-containing protein [Rheinheimera sp. KL1]
MPFILSIVMTFVISIVTSGISLGFSDFTLLRWLSAWGISWLIAFPTLLMVLPIVRELTKRIIKWANTH